MSQSNRSKRSVAVTALFCSALLLNLIGLFVLSLWLTLSADNAIAALLCVVDEMPLTKMEALTHYGALGFLAAPPLLLLALFVGFINNALIGVAFWLRGRK